MSIRDVDRYLAAHFDFSPIEDSFPGAIRPSDIDGIVEMRGKFLTLEGKTEHGTVGAAADRMFRNRVTTMVDTVIVFWANKDDPTQINSPWKVLRMRIYRYGRRPEDVDPASTDDLRECCRQWAAWADPSRRRR